MTGRTAVLAGLVLAAPTAPAPAAAADSGGFPDLSADTRVYDTTGRSLSADTLVPALWTPSPPLSTVRT